MYTCIYIYIYIYVYIHVHIYVYIYRDIAPNMFVPFQTPGAEAQKRSGKRGRLISTKSNIRNMPSSCGSHAHHYPSETRQTVVCPCLCVSPYIYIYMWIYIYIYIYTHIHNIHNTCIHIYIYIFNIERERERERHREGGLPLLSAGAEAARALRGLRARSLGGLQDLGARPLYIMFIIIIMIIRDYYEIQRESCRLVS